MKYYNKLICTILIIMGMVSCDDAFLNNAPIAEESTESFYTNYESLNSTSTAAYGMLCSRDVYDIMYSIGFQTISDDSEVGGENINDWPEFQHMDRLTHTSKEDRVHRMWAYAYKGIRMTNEVLDRSEAIKEYEVASRGEDKAQEYIDLIDVRVAEMHFLRAFYHFTLLQVYGGVIIMDYRESGEEQTAPRSTIAEVLHFVQDELRMALPYLREKSEMTEEIGRATVGAANALLAKAFLYESSYAKNYAADTRFEGCVQHYDSALYYAEEVMNSSEYDLVGSGGERYPSWNSMDGSFVGGYRWIFTLDGDNSSESVWSIQSVKDGLGWTKSRGNYMTVYTTIRFCFDANGKAGKTAGGWSFNLPTEYLVNAFGNNDTRETGLNSTVVDENLDPRFQTTIGREGDYILVDEPGVDTWYEMDFQNLPTGTISRKYECSPDEFWSSYFDFQDGPMNIRLIRYADVVLMAAEAAYETSNTSAALTYTNMVRERARMSGDTGYPVALTAISFEDIVHERRLELAMESSRYFDLIRWNLGPTYINGITLASMGDGFALEYVSGKHEFLPIPETEMQKNSGLVQYDAWQ